MYRRTIWRIYNTPGHFSVQNCPSYMHSLFFNIKPVYKKLGRQLSDLKYSKNEQTEMSELVIR